jgi:hypothetical protein
MWKWTPYGSATEEDTARRDSDNPWSGRWSVRAGMGNLNWGDVPVRAGMALELRFRARGTSNGAPLDIMLRQSAPIDRVFFRVNTGLTDDWREYVYRTALPADIPADARIYLGFWTRVPGFRWLDDLSLRELPVTEGGEAPTINPVRNPSFEAGVDGWTATIREGEFGDKWSWHDTGVTYPNPSDAKIESLAASAGDEAPHGKRYFSVTVKEQCRAVVTSAYFPARYGHKMKLVFHARSNGGQWFEAGIGGGKNSDISIQGRPVPSSTRWQRHEIPLTLKVSGGGFYVVRFAFDKPGTYDIDAVSFVEEASPVKTLYPPSVAIQAAAGMPLASLFDRGDKAVFKLVVADEKPRTPLAWDIGVVDYLDNKTALPGVSLTTGADGYGEVLFEVPTSQFGAFRIEAARKSSGNPNPTATGNTGGEVLAEQLYSVLPELPEASTRPDSFFGSHVDLTPWNLEIARRAGFRWLRLYPPLTTKWLVVEPGEPGKWVFKTKDLVRARAMGFRILGSFDTVADHAADVDPASPVKNRWSAAYPPRDIGQWKDYVVRTFTAFAPYIDAWEIWNEPDGAFLRVRPGVRKDDVLLALFKATREALDSTGKPYELIAPGTAGISPALSWELLDRGAGKWLDGFSFHYYGIHAGSTSPDSDLVRETLAKYRFYKNRAGEVMPLWNTEGGLGGGSSWLNTYRIPKTSTGTPSTDAAAMIRATLLLKALGLKRYINYFAGASEAGRNVQHDHCTTSIETTGLPNPGIASHAAMVLLTEDAAPAGFDTREVDGSRVSCARFVSPDGRNVEAWWSVDDLPLARAAAPAPGAGDEVYDMMGNRVTEAAADSAKVGRFPFYVLRHPANK